MDRRLHVFAWLLAAGGVAVLMVNIAWAWRFTVDDSYITLRYSRHFVEQCLKRTLHS